MTQLHGRTIAFLLLSACLCLVFVAHSTILDQFSISPLSSFKIAPDRGIDVVHTTKPSSDHNQSPRILLVSAFFPLRRSKHSLVEYDMWLSYFLGQITTDLYIFCPPEFVPVIQRFRGSLSVTIDTTYGSPFDTPPLLGREAEYAHMHRLDPEKLAHSPELYAIWNAKPFFLEQGLSQASSNGTQYDYAFWSDAGSMRSYNPYTSWPSPSRVARFFHEAALRTGTPGDELIFFPFVWPPDRALWMWNENDGPTMTQMMSVGSFFGGKSKAITQYARTFYTYHDHWLAAGHFVGKDQTMINALIFLYAPHFFGVLVNDWPMKPGVGTSDSVTGPLGACDNTWWYYEWWLADTAEREKMADEWVVPGDGQPPRNVDLMVERPAGSIRCREADLITARELLQKGLGRWYSPPKASLPWGSVPDASHTT